MTRLKNSNCDNIKTQTETKLKCSNCEKEINSTVTFVTEMTLMTVVTVITVVTAVTVVTKNSVTTNFFPLKIVTKLTTQVVTRIK